MIASQVSDSVRRSCKYPHCSKKAEVKGFCRGHYKRYEKVRTTLEGTKALPWCHPYDFHCVYVVGCDELPYFKVGRSKSVLGRVEQLQGAMPFDLKIFAARFAHPDITMALEYNTHKVLTECDLHQRGEWFHVSPEDVVAVIDKCANMNDLECYAPADYDKLCMRDKGVGLDRFKEADEDDLRSKLISKIELGC